MFPKKNIINYLRVNFKEIDSVIFVKEITECLGFHKGSKEEMVNF